MRTNQEQEFADPQRNENYAICDCRKKLQPGRLF
jgi:hypothetical protein